MMSGARGGCVFHTPYMIKTALIALTLTLVALTALYHRLPATPLSSFPEPAAGPMSVLRAPAVYLTHGGGPFPVIGGPGHAKLTAFLKSYAASLPSPPRALLVVSGHWEAFQPTVTSAANPELIYDYHGFPPDSYELKYAAPGSPQLADKVCSLLQAAGMACQKDAKRGWDHGTFIPLMLMFPEAAIPVVQLSLLASLDPKEHIRMGEALAPLRDEGVAIIGSGSSFHNLPALFAALGGDSSALARSKSFDEWLQYVCTDPSLSYEKRAEMLAAWRQAPEASYAHPREEHLLPLHVVFGAGKSETGRLVFDDIAMGVQCSSVQYG